MKPSDPAATGWQRSRTPDPVRVLRVHASPGLPRWQPPPQACQSATAANPVHAGNLPARRFVRLPVEFHPPTLKDARCQLSVENPGNILRESADLSPIPVPPAEP